MDKDQKKRVLFIGNRSALSRIAGETGKRLSQWEPVFAPTRESAMHALAESEFHAVVADDAIGPRETERVLREVKEKWPNVARLAVVDQPNAKQTPPPVAAVHVVPRACGVDDMETSLERSAAVHAIVTEPKIREVVGTVESLPTLPKTYREVMAVTNREDASALLVAKALEKDPALSLKVLQVVNSVTFGLRQRISSVQQAVSYLGMELIKGIVLTAEIFQSAERAKPQGFSLERFQDYSIRVGRLAAEFGKGRGIGEEAFTAGLLHDVGKLVLSMKRATQFTEALLRIAETGEDTEVVEREMLGITHSHAGAYLLWTWGIPYPIVECVALHHATHLVRGGANELVAVVHAAEALYGIHACRDPESKLDMELIERAGMAKEIPQWRARVAESVG